MSSGQQQYRSSSPGTKKQVLLRLDENDTEALYTAASAAHVSINALAANAIAEYISNYSVEEIGKEVRSRYQDTVSQLSGETT